MIIPSNDAPTVCDRKGNKITFGPLEDRFHMQLAVDSQSDFHVTWDRAILAEAANMASFGVAEVNPPAHLSANT